MQEEVIWTFDQRCEIKRASWKVPALYGFCSTMCRIEKPIPQKKVSKFYREEFDYTNWAMVNKIYEESCHSDKKSLLWIVFTRHSDITKQDEFFRYAIVGQFQIDWSKKTRKTQAILLHHIQETYFWCQSCQQRTFNCWAC